MPDVRRRRPEEECDRGAEHDQRRRDERQQQVLDHVDREQGRVVRVDARHEGNRDGADPEEEADRPPPRHGIGGVGPIDLTDEPTQTTAAATSARKTAGSIVQPKSRFATDGGSAGTGPWAIATPDAASAASAPIGTARRATRRTEARDGPAIAVIVARNPLAPPEAGRSHPLPRGGATSHPYTTAVQL